MLYLGIDSSTQGIKGIVIDPEKGNITETALNFGKDLPQYHSPEGYLEQPDPLIKQADPCMWLDGLDLLLQRLQKAGVPMDKIAGVSGSAQQHGSVYLNSGAKTSLANLNPEQSLSEQLKHIFSRKYSPIWMDRSTEKECAELKEKFGTLLQKCTGSPAIERFTGPQIRKFAKEEPENYRKTEKIHLVSSFLCSVLTGKHAPVDFGDGAGMNMLDLNTHEYHPDITEFTAPGLKEKLPPAAGPGTAAGGLSPYFEKYGMRQGIPVIVWSGDNPCSLVGTGCTGSGVTGISLGTSDTVFSSMQEFQTDPDGHGHIIGKPTGGFMSLLCFSNGSLAREQIKNKCGISWEEFDSLSRKSTGKNYPLMLPYFYPETTPLRLTPEVKYNFDPASVSPEKMVRILLESQALTMRLHTGWLPEKIRGIRLTGGASACKGFRQIIADVFQADVETILVSNSAGLGAALIVANVVGKYPFNQLFEQFCGTVETTKPNPAMKEYYDTALIEYKKLENHQM